MAKKWIQSAIKHPGRCTPLSKPGCTGAARALALRFKTGDLHRDHKMMRAKKRMGSAMT
jgi:hypothetical protein